MAVSWRGTSSCLAWTGETRPDGTHIVFSGEFDLSAVGGAHAGLAEILASADKWVTFDLGALTFMDSTGLRFLLDTQRALEVRRVGLALKNVPDIVGRILDVTSTKTMFTIEPNGRPDLYAVG